MVRDVLRATGAISAQGGEEHDRVQVDTQQDFGREATRRLPIAHPHLSPWKGVW